jgi:hypothetical protein
VRKRKKSDSLVWALESALDLGEFVSYNHSWDFVRDLEDVKHKIDALVKDGDAERAVSLYELFTVPWECASLNREKANITDMPWNISGRPKSYMKKPAGISCGWILLKEFGRIIPANTALSLISKK